MKDNIKRIQQISCKIITDLDSPACPEKKSTYSLYGYLLQ